MGEVDEGSFQLRRDARRRGRSIERTLKPQPFLPAPLSQGDIVQVIANKGNLESLLLNNGYDYNPLNDLMLGGTFQALALHPNGFWAFLPSPDNNGFLALPRQAVKKLPEVEISPEVVSEFVVNGTEELHRMYPEGVTIWTVPTRALWEMSPEERCSYAVRHLPVDWSDEYVFAPWGQHVYGIIMDNGYSCQLATRCPDGTFRAANIFLPTTLPTQLGDDAVLMEAPEVA